ncbi:MAG: hypothetical protein KA465_02610, partial [Anaerolineaceae bacterium]|nr:hypothetical protein [Anaerolineaceae bacterium]
RIKAWTPSSLKGKYAGCVSCTGAFCPMICAGGCYATKEESLIRIGTKPKNIRLDRLSVEASEIILLN